MPVGHQLVLVRDSAVRVRAFSGEASTWYGECQLRSRAVWPGLGVVQPERLFSLPGLQALSPLVEQGWWYSPGPDGVPNARSRAGSFLALPPSRLSHPSGGGGMCSLESPRPQPRRERWPSPWQLRKRCQNNRILRSYVLKICCDCLKILITFYFTSVQLLSRVRLFTTP